MKVSENPALVTHGMDEDDDIDELIEALANNVAANPDNVHSVSVTAVTSASADVSSFSIEVTFRNQVGQTCAVDGILEKLNMRDWRIFCDKFLEKMLESSGRKPDAYDWPTPHPEVTKVPEEDDTDIIASVRIKWSLDERTWTAAKAYVKDRVRRHVCETGEEMCVNCDTQIRYKVKKGNSVVTCPECGALNPICNECTRPEREKNACDRCKIYIICKALNKQMAEWGNEK